LFLFFKISDAVALPLVAIEGVHWARDRPKLAYRGDGCNASYIAKYNLVQHLWVHHNVTMDLEGHHGPRCPCTRKEGPKHHDYTTMNKQVLSNPLAQFRRNEQKASARARKHTNLGWDRLQVYLQYTPKVPKPALVSFLASLHGVWGPSPSTCRPSWSTMKTLHLWFKWLKLGTQRPSKVFGWNMTGSLHRIKQSSIRKLASLRNTMNHKWFMVSNFLTMPYSILFELYVLSFICNTYCIALFVVRFKTPLGKCLWLMLLMQH
jgi:hypothetical protein